MEEHGELRIFLCDCNADLPDPQTGTEYVIHNTCFEAIAAEDNGNGGDEGNGGNNGGEDEGNGGNNGGEDEGNGGDNEGGTSSGGGGSSDTSSETTGGGLDGGAIAGIVVGSLAGVGLIWFGISRSGVLTKAGSSSVIGAGPFYAEEAKVFI